MTDDGPPIGHIKLARKMFASNEDWLEPRVFSRFEAWVYMIQLAAWRQRRYQTTKYGTIELERGQFVASIRHLAGRWQWTVKTVRGYLAAGEKSGKIRAQQVTQAGTVYLLVNYDAYQSTPTDEGTAKGTPRAHLGHKREASKAITALTTLSDSPEDRVLAHYLAQHPRRRIGPKDRTAVAKALTFGYAPEELCAAIDGNASDRWHQSKHKHELPYVLRDSGKIDSFRGLASAPKGVIGVIDGEMSPELERLTRPGA